MPEQVVPVGMDGEPGDHRNAEPVQVIGELVASERGRSEDENIPFYRNFLSRGDRI